MFFCIFVYLLYTFFCFSTQEYKTYKENFLKRFQLTKLPPYLIFCIKRFTKNNFFVEKNPTIVNFPITWVKSRYFLTGLCVNMMCKYVHFFRRWHFYFVKQECGPAWISDRRSSGHRKEHNLWSDCKRCAWWETHWGVVQNSRSSSCKSEGQKATTFMFHLPRSFTFHFLNAFFLFLNNFAFLKFCAQKKRVCFLFKSYYNTIKLPWFLLLLVNFGQFLFSRP